MPRLFTYCVRVDDGAAPNPYWGVCTLTICKPVIRRTAKVGDWIVGTGSVERGLGGQIVYAMEVSAVMPLAEYDKWTREHCPEKIPDVNHRDLRRRVGDSIYDYSVSDPPVQRPGVHLAGNIKTDLGGKNALLSLNFYYFGRDAEPLPDDLQCIVHQTQGHKVNANDPHVDRFLSWFRKQGFERNCVRTEPDLLQEIASGLSGCAEPRRRCDEEDEKTPVC